jgi:hypothetical protein
MPQPARITAAAGATRLGERLISRVLEHRIALGALFLAVCGWKFTFGLDYVLDLRLGDETKYLAYATGYLPGPLLPEWSPLYVYFYKLEHLLAHDPVALFFLHEKLLATLLPIAFFVFLASRAVPFFLALGCSVYLMISVADLPVGPKTLHLALAVMFLALALFVRLGKNPLRCGMLIAAAGVLSLIRAEFLIPLGALTLYAAYLAFTKRRPDWRLLSAIAGGLLVVAALFASLGSPLFGGRSMFAFAQHFALNYASWEKLPQDPWTADYQTIFHRVFGDAGSVPAAFFANPPAFLHHVLTNLAHAPIVLAGLFFGHFNLFLPRFEGLTLVEAGMFALLLLGCLGYCLNVAFARARPVGPPATMRGRLKQLGERARAAPDVVSLAVLLLPFVMMMTLLYPRYHYALACGTIVLALAIIAAAPYLPRLELGGRSLLALPLLLAIVPSVGSVGVRPDRVLGELRVVPRPALATVDYLRRLAIRTPVVICQSQEPGVAAYVGHNYAEIEEEQKTQGLRDFIAAHDVAIFVADDRMRQDPRFARDPEWAKFEANPASLGFTAHALPDTDVVLYLKDTLLPPRLAAAAGPR